MAEDASQEERLGHFCNPIARGYRWFGDCAGDHRELSDANSAPKRPRHRTTDHGDLPALWVERPPDRNPRARYPEAGLLLPVASRQSTIRTRSWRGRARVHRDFLEG